MCPRLTSHYWPMLRYTTPCTTLYSNQWSCLASVPQAKGFVLFVVHPATATLDEWKERTFCFANGTNPEHNFYTGGRWRASEMPSRPATPDRPLASSDWPQLEAGTSRLMMQRRRERAVRLPSTPWDDPQDQPWRQRTRQQAATDIFFCRFVADSDDLFPKRVLMIWTDTEYSVLLFFTPQHNSNFLCGLARLPWSGGTASLQLRVLAG